MPPFPNLHPAVSKHPIFKKESSGIFISTPSPKPPRINQKFHRILSRSPPSIFSLHALPLPLFSDQNGSQPASEMIKAGMINSAQSNERYNYFLSMENTEGMGIFFEEKHTETLQEQVGKDELMPESVPYLQRGDSSKYLEQFFAKNETPPPPKSPSEPSKKEEANSVELDEDFSLSSRGKFNPSAFHNFQKHLTVCLKHSIQIKLDEHLAEGFEKVAAKLWKAFRQSSVSTKKVLHYLLGERNEHKISETGLKEFGLAKIYEEAGDAMMAEARKFLAVQTIRQIGEGKLEEYINAKKLKDKPKFKKYVQIFVEQLENGFLRKRLPKDKVLELQRC